ncbi:MAG: cupin domain-containing protein [Desulfovibrio sp.]|nr:cupin domain-containing protein [Desulfovibrio sp.]
MKKIFASCMMLMLPFSCVCHASAADAQTVIRAGENKSQPGPDNWFTGKVSIDRLFPREDNNVNASGAYVTFEPGARTAWHEHPAGQTLVVVQGVGRTGTADGRVWEIRAGDVVRCPANVRHWHGAAPDTGMTHMAITGYKGDANSIWHDKVTDEEYNRPIAR